MCHSFPRRHTCGSSAVFVTPCVENPICLIIIVSHVHTNLHENPASGPPTPSTILPSRFLFPSFLPPHSLNRQLPASLDQSMHAPAPQPHFSSSVHSTPSVQSGVTDRSLYADDDSAAASAAAAAAAAASATGLATLGGTGGLGMLERRRHLDAVRNRVSVASLSILEYYAETAGRRIANVLQVSSISGGVALRDGEGYRKICTGGRG